MGFKITRDCALESSMIEKIRRRAALPESALRTMDPEELSEVRDCKRWVDGTLIFVMDGKRGGRR